MTSPEVPLDLQGPVDRPFDRMGADFAGAPAIQHLKAVARKFADKIALSDGTRHITYSDLLARVLKLANAIAAITSEGEAVGSFLGNSVWQPIAMLACMAAGRLLVPLNTRDPARRLTDITAAARISVLIGQGESWCCRMDRRATNYVGSILNLSTSARRRWRILHFRQSPWMHLLLCSTHRAAPANQRGL